VATTTIRPAHTRVGDPALAARLRAAIEGEVSFDPFERGRYSTDASIYQIEPIGVVRPHSHDDVLACLTIARDEGISVLPRGGGTSQAGQTVGRSLVIDHSRHLRRLQDLDVEERTCWVEPGIVLDELNRELRQHGLFFPVDISTGSRATIGGMTANNSCGARSLRYGVMVDNVLEIEAVLATGENVRFGPVSSNLGELAGDTYPALVQDMRALATREADEIRNRTPGTARHVGGYNLHRIDPQGPHNMASLLVGSEGTLAWFSRIRLRLSPLPTHKLLGVCHFPTFHAAMDAAQHIVALDPTAVELVDRSILDLAGKIPEFSASLPKFVRGQPDSLLLVEFAGDDPGANRDGLTRLDALMADLGFRDAVVEAVDPTFQSEIWELRKAGLNIAMSMKGDGKPVSFIEDCAVPLEHLAEYTAGLKEVFARHGTSGTWYAHASVGCLHVRPILNLKLERGAETMRAIAEEAIDLVRRFKGAHSGEHGDGLVRSDFHVAVFGPRLVRAFEEVKDRFDPGGLFNAHPSKIVRAPRMDDRSLFRFGPDYAALPIEAGLDWSAWGGPLAAAEMCNNNGACRKTAGGVMCPSYRATRQEKDVTRGRANTLRLALSGQLGPDALTSDGMLETLSLCVSCKACKRECPTGVDMARLKTEVLHQRNRRQGVPRRDRLIANLPHIAWRAGGLRFLLNLRNRLPGAAALGEAILGISAKRCLPVFRTPFRPPAPPGAASGRQEIVLFVDTFNRYFEPENVRAAVRVLEAGHHRVVFADWQGQRPLCCGRTFLAAGMVEEARAEARRTRDALLPFIERGVAVVGLEPSCLLTMRDEFDALLPGGPTDRLAGAARLFSEFLVEERGEGRLDLELRPVAGEALVHGHCHEKAFGAFGSVLDALGMIPALTARGIESSCCGMAGAFGYEATHHDVSMAMAEASLLPAVRRAAAETIVVADGTSCRHQIRDGAGREAVHLARVLARALPG
jgi:FAD/FMN-containing dehydrogenase/Fe-S oxidoreductase